MSIFLIWNSSNPPSITSDQIQIEPDEGIKNVEILSTKNHSDLHKPQLPTFNENLDEITEEVLETASKDLSLRILVVHLKPTLIDPQNRTLGYQHRPRLEPLKYLIQNIQTTQDQADEQNLGVLVNLANPYCHRGFVALDTNDPKSSVLFDHLIQLGTLDHPYFSVYHYGETYLPLESRYTNIIIQNLFESETFYFFSLFKSGFRAQNELRLIKCLKKIARENRLDYCEIYYLEPQFDLVIDYALIGCSEPQFFAKMSESQKSELAEISGYQEKFQFDYTYGEFLRYTASRFRVLEKEKVLTEDAPSYPEVVRGFEKDSEENLLFKGPDYITPAIYYVKLKDPFLKNFLKKASMTFKFQRGSKKVSIVVVYEEASDAFKCQSSLEKTFSDLKLSYIWKIALNSTEKNILNQKMREICREEGLNETFGAFINEDMVSSIPQASEFEQNFKKYYKEGYSYSVNTQTELSIIAYHSAVNSSGVGEEKSHAGFFEKDHSRSVGFQFSKSDSKSSLLSRDFMFSKIIGREELNNKIMIQSVANAFKNIFSQKNADGYFSKFLKDLNEDSLHPNQIGALLNELEDKCSKINELEIKIHEVSKTLLIKAKANQTSLQRIKKLKLDQIKHQNKFSENFFETRLIRFGWILIEGIGLTSKMDLKRKYFSLLISFLQDRIDESSSMLETIKEKVETGPRLEDLFKEAETIQKKFTDQGKEHCLNDLKYAEMEEKHKKLKDKLCKMFDKKYRKGEYHIKEDQNDDDSKVLFQKLIIKTKSRRKEFINMKKLKTSYLEIVNFETNVIEAQRKSLEELAKRIFSGEENLVQKIENQYKVLIKQELNSIGIEANLEDIDGSYLEREFVREALNESLKDVITSFIQFKQKNQEFKVKFLGKKLEVEKQEKMIIQSNIQLLKQDHLSLVYKIALKLHKRSSPKGSKEDLVNFKNRDFKLIIKTILNQSLSKFKKIKTGIEDYQKKLGKILDEYQKIAKNNGQIPLEYVNGRNLQISTDFNPQLIFEGEPDRGPKDGAQVEDKAF